MSVWVEMQVNQKTVKVKISVPVVSDRSAIGDFGSFFFFWTAISTGTVLYFAPE